MDASKIGLKYPHYPVGLQKQQSFVQGNDFAALVADAVSKPEEAAKIVKGAGTSHTVMLDSSQGQVGIDIDRYFAKPEEPVDFDGPNAPPLLMPTEHNINALAKHASAKLKTLMAANNIPAGPAEITYDPMGTMHLPQDYAYADQFKKMLADNPDMDKELRTVNALTSSYTEMQKSLPFVLEYQEARSASQANAVVAKYSHLFSDQRSFSAIALSFSADGSLVPMADGMAYNAA